MSFYGKKFYITLLICLTCFWPLSSLYAQPMPALICVSVSPDGSLYASWAIPSGSFDGFRLFYKKSTDAFYSSVDVHPAITSVIVPVTDAQTEKYDVFLITYNNSPPSNSPESVHLNNMLLVVSNAGVGSGIARLDWTPMKPGGDAVEYVVKRSMDNVNFTEIGTSNKLIYYDTIEGICTPQTIYYRITLRLTGCTARSSTGSGTFKDDNRPEDPRLSYVTINNGFAEIYWEHSPTADVDGYIVGIKDGAAYLDHDTTAYVNFLIDDFTGRPTYRYPCDESVTYVLRAKDQCGNQSSGIINYNQLHHTIHITGDIESHCNRQGTLHWNQYINMDPPVTAYEIYRSENGNMAEVAGVVAATSSGTYSYTDTLMLNSGSLYTYSVKAVNGVNTEGSQSCQLYFSPIIESITDFDLDLVTVSDDNYITLQSSGSPDELMDKVNVYRGTASSASLELIFTGNWNGSPVTLSDYEAKVHQESYYYQVVALDACGYELAESRVYRSILLELSSPERSHVRLNWNAFVGWDESLKGYQIYRLEGGLLSAGFPKEVGPQTLVFNDIISDAGAGKITYYVEAIHEDGRKSISNTVQIIPEAVVQVPTAFRIGGYTPEFRPLLRNVEPSAYLFTIYNRWGQLVFETADIDVAWDGSTNGSLSPPGVYIWMVNYSDYNGNKSSVKGAVTLIR